ncbi:MAG: type II toxin-antitoxin system VapC family toxin [Rhodopirellula sp.]|nr:type II toxin-antitoxin system VapC family toxin [Rhodopirellula sp.]
MKVEEVFQQVQRLFLDTAPVIYYVESHPKYRPVVDAIFDGIDDGRLPAVTSPITLSECLVVPYRFGDVSAQEHFADLIIRGQGVLFVVIDEGIAQRAAELRAHYNLSLTDAFQIGTALVAGCDALLTNDATLKRVQELGVIVVDELEP